MFRQMIHFTRRFVSPPVLRLFIFVGIVWAAIVGPLSSVLVLKGIGATSQQIGVFTAICAVISMVFQPIWGVLSDKVGSPRRVLCFCLGASAAFFGCVLLTQNFYAAAGLFFLDTMFRCCVISLLDSHTLFEVNVIPGLQYSHIRMAGSVFFGSLSFVYGRIISAEGVRAIVPLSMGVAVFAVLFGLFAAKGQWEAAKEPGDVRRARPNLKKEAMILLANKRYIIFLIFTALWALAVMPMYTFIIDYVTAVGGNPGDVPMIHAISCAVELPFFILAGTVGRRIEPQRLMLAGTCFSLAFMAGLLFANTFFWLGACHILGAPGFILVLTGRMRFLSDIAPESVRSTSITLMGACEVGLGSIVGNLIAGFVSGIYGTRALTLVSMAAICASMMVLVFVLGMPRLGRPDEREKT